MGAEVASYLKNIETELNLLLQELAENTGGSNDDTLETQHTEESKAWDKQLEDFRLNAVTIRKILEKFHSADLSTRRYLISHVDEEWSGLKNNYELLREEFKNKK